MQKGHSQTKEPVTGQPTREDIDRLLAFLPLFDVCGRTFIVDGPDGHPDYQTLHVLPFPAYEDYMQAFFREASRPCWQVDLTEPDDVASIVYCECEIALAGLSDIQRMITWLVTSGNELPNHRQMLAEDGRIASILRRLRRIRIQLFGEDSAV